MLIRLLSNFFVPSFSSTDNLYGRMGEVSRLECRFVNPGKERNDYETPSLKVETVVEKGEVENERK